MNNNQAVEVFKALADPARLEIVRRLAKQPDTTPSCDVVRSCPNLSKLSQPATSHHFSKLVDAGVITEAKVGTGKFYELNIDLLSQLGIDANKL